MQEFVCKKKQGDIKCLWVFAVLSYQGKDCTKCSNTLLFWLVLFQKEVLLWLKMERLRIETLQKLQHNSAPYGSCSIRRQQGTTTTFSGQNNIYFQSQFTVRLIRETTLSSYLKWIKVMLYDAMDILFLFHFYLFFAKRRQFRYLPDIFDFPFSNLLKYQLKFRNLLFDQ